MNLYSFVGNGNAQWATTEYRIENLKVYNRSRGYIRGWTN